MKDNQRIQKMCTAALLCAVGILIPIISPVKLQFGPMSFTLASHVAVFIALFISPAVAVTVEVGTTLGFVLAGFPPVVWLRAAVQVFFVVLGALWLKKRPQVMDSAAGKALFGLVLGVVHGVAEAVVVVFFWFGGLYRDAGYSFMTLIWGLVCGGTIVHSMVDYYLAMLIWAPVHRAVRIQAMWPAKKKQAV